MTATAGTPSWEEIARTWGARFSFSYDPEEHPEEPHAATRKDGKGTVRAATHAELLDQIKDDLTNRPFDQDPAPAREGKRC